MARLRLNNISSFGLTNPITLSAASVTTATWTSAPAFPTIANGTYAAIVVEPDSANEEVIYLTAYTSGASTGTVTRAQEGTTAIAHNGTAWGHNPTATDLNSADAQQQTAIRAATFQDQTERGGSTGAAAIVAGQQGLIGSTETRQRVIDVVVGDSIGQGGGSTPGATDHQTILATNENRVYNFVDPIFGFVYASNWNTLSNGSVAAAGANGGPGSQPTSWTLGTTGDTISDINTTLSVATLAASVAPYNNFLVAQATISGIIQGQSINGTGLSGNGIASNAYVQAVNGSASVAVTNCTVVTGGAYATSTSSLTGVFANMAVTGSGIPGTTSAPQVFVQQVIGNQVVLMGSVTSITGGTVTLTFTPTISMTTAAVAAGTNTVTFGRGFRRCKVYYQLVTNGDGVVFNVTGGSAPTSASIDTNGSGIGVWDSGDLGANVGTGITATWGAHGTGSGGGRSYVMGVEYIQNNGLQGVVLHNLAIPGTTSTQWANRVTNTEAWLSFLASQGTPARRCYIYLGINDLNVQYGYTPANFLTNLTTLITGYQAASPLTEIVLVVEQYGDVIQFIGQCTNSATAVTSGTVTVSTVNTTTGATDSPEVGSLIYAPGQPATVVATVASVIAGTSFTCNLSGSGTFRAAASVQMIASQTRGGAANYSANWVPVIEQLALTYGCTLVNLYERFGDISVVTSLQSCTTNATNTVTVAASVLPQGVVAGQYVYGQTIVPGTSVASVGSTAFTLSQAAYGSGTQTLSFTHDQYGVTQQSLAGGPHLGDFNQSFSGRDGQRAMAQTFKDKLAYANQTQSPTTLVTSTPADGLITQTISTTSQGTPVVAGFQDANDNSSIWSVGGQVGSALTPGLYTGPGGTSAHDTTLARAAGAATGFGYWILKNGVRITGPSGSNTAVRLVGGTANGPPSNASSFLLGDVAFTTNGYIWQCNTSGTGASVWMPANQNPITVTVASKSASVSSNYCSAVLTNNAAASVSINMLASSAQDGQQTTVRFYDHTNAAQTLAWVNTENSGASVPTTSNGSTTHPITVQFIFNGVTSLWRCINST